MGEDTSTNGVITTVPSLEGTLGCHASIEGVLGHIALLQMFLHSILCEQGARASDMHIQASALSCTSKEEDSLDSTCTQKSLRPPQTSQETMGNFLSPKEYEPPLPSTP